MGGFQVYPPDLLGEIRLAHSLAKFPAPYQEIDQEGSKQFGEGHQQNAAQRGAFNESEEYKAVQRGAHKA